MHRPPHMLISMMDTSISVTLASQGACQSCRTGKQRCDKVLPSCSRCTIKRITCSYMRQVTPSVFHRPCCFDITPDWARELLEATRANDSSPNLSHLINNMFDATRVTRNGIVSEYFATIHPWLPIIDQGQFSKWLQQWPYTEDGTIATLMWTLFVITRRPCLEDDHSVDNLMYQTTRQMFMIQACGEATVKLLRAGLLITYYACGHGLTREAHLTLATCITIAQHMGIQFTNISNPLEVPSEQSACRWAIVLLDRTIALSSFVDSLPLVLPPSLIDPAEYPPSLTEPDWPKCSFDVSSRVALRLGTALSYANDQGHTRSSGPTYSDTYQRVGKVIRDLICASQTKSDSYLYCESTSFAVSTLFALQTANREADKTDYDPEEQLLLQSTIRIIRENLRMSSRLLKESDNRGISVVALCSLCRASAILVRHHRSDLSSQDIGMMRADLVRYSARWVICRKYLSYIDKMITHCE